MRLLCKLHIHNYLSAGYGEEHVHRGKWLVCRSVSYDVCVRCDRTKNSYFIDRVLRELTAEEQANDRRR